MSLWTSFTIFSGEKKQLQTKTKNRIKTKEKQLANITLNKEPPCLAYVNIFEQGPKTLILTNLLDIYNYNYNRSTVYLMFSKFLAKSTRVKEILIVLVVWEH